MPSAQSESSERLDPNQMTTWNVAEAMQAQQGQMVAAMLEQGCDPNAKDARGNTALHWACFCQFNDLLRRLIDYGARLDAMNDDEEAPSHWAAKSSNVIALGILSRANPAVLVQRDSDGFTPFIICAQRDNGPLMEWLYMEGITVDEQDDCARTALHWACYKGHRRTVQWLLSRSASIMHRDREGMTAIHWGALRGHEHICEMLLDVGSASLLSVQEIVGDTPVTLAARRQNRYIAFSLLKCRLLHLLIGRPFLWRNSLANLFVVVMALNFVVAAIVLAPTVLPHCPMAQIYWFLLMLGSSALWVWNFFADPGWIGPQTIFPQKFESRIASVVTEAWEDSFDVADMPGSIVRSFPSSRAHLLAGNEELEMPTQRHRLTDSARGFPRPQRRKDEYPIEAMGSVGAGVCCATVTSECTDLPGISTMPTVGERRPLMVSSSECSADASPFATDRAFERMRNLGIERTQEVCTEYLNLLRMGEFKQICVICRSRRRLRSHHCKECGRCVDRLDHHCPWIDNCVGLKNQRSFYWFILVLFAALVSFYRVLWLFVCYHFFPADAVASLSALEVVLASRRLWTGGGGTLLVLLTSGMNFIWLVFVGALVIRHTAYMCVNITTFEVLVRPCHVRRRFPKTRGLLWFFSGFGFVPCVRHCSAFWTLSTEATAEEFLQVSLSSEAPCTPQAVFQYRD